MGTSNNKEADNGVGPPSALAAYKPGWLAFAFQVLTLLVMLGAIYGSVDQRLTTLEHQAKSAEGVEERIVADLSEVRASVSRTEENTRHLEQQIGSLNTRMDKLHDLLTEYVMDQNGQIRGFHGVE